MATEVTFGDRLFRREKIIKLCKEQYKPDDNKVMKYSLTLRLRPQSTQ